jgi:hypothetical protein
MAGWKRLSSLQVETGDLATKLPYHNLNFTPSAE